MTNRARWILAIAICGMVLGILSRISPFAILNLIFISWIGIEWFAFRLKTLRAHTLFAEAVREIDGNAAESLSLSLNEDYDVSLRVVFHRQLQGLRFFLSDLVPGGILSTDRFPAVVDLQHQFQVQWKYRITPQVTGQLALPGLQVTVTDAYGFFSPPAIRSPASETDFAAFCHSAPEYGRTYQAGQPSTDDRTPSVSQTRDQF